MEKEDPWVFRSEGVVLDCRSVFLLSGGPRDHIGLAVVGSDHRPLDGEGRTYTRTNSVVL